MAAKKKTSKKAAVKKTGQRAATPSVSGGDAPAAFLAAPTPPPPSALAGDAFLQKKAQLDAVASSFNKEGHMVMVRGDQAPNPYILRRPTGIMELDIDLAGGFPAGGMCFVSGPDNSGKTWLMMHTMAMQQRIHGNNCVLAMAVTEGGFPYDQAMRVGMRISVPDVMIAQWQQTLLQRGLAGYTDEQFAYFKHQIGDFRIIRGSTGEEILTVMLKVAETGACSVLALDSIQGLQPVADAGKEMDENEKRAAHASMMGRFLKKYIPLTTGLNGSNETTLLMTQQVRSNANKATAPAHIQQYLSDWAISSGWTSRHFKLVDLVVSDGALEKKDVPGFGKKTVAKELKWFFEKGKAGTHDNINGAIKYSYEMPQGVDMTQTVLDAGVRRGIIQKVGNKVTVVRPDTKAVMPEYAAPNMTQFYRCMQSDFEFELAVRQEILAGGGVNCLYR